MIITMHIKGAAELDRMLRDLPPTVSRTSAAAALRAGARVIQAEAKRNAPVAKDTWTRKQDYAGTAAGSGALRRAIKVKTDAFKGGTLRRVVVVVSAKAAGINPHWLEYGTTATRVSPKGGFLYFVIDGRLMRKKAVAGVKEHRFMRSAADAKWQEAVNVVGDQLGKAVAAAAARLGTIAR